jgi:hypothetical protein
MKTNLILLLAITATHLASAQYVYTIKADSVKLTNCDSTDLIIENHTQCISGFLFNTGRGRTAFRRPLTKVNDSLYLVGNDSLRLPNAWLQGGNAFGKTGVLGTKDNNNIDFYTSNLFRARLTNTGHLLVRTTKDSSFNLSVGGSARFEVPQGGNNQVVFSANDAYDIKMIPEYVLGPVGYSTIAFGSIWATIGVNKQQAGTIPSGSLLMGHTSPGRITAMVDYGSNPAFVVDGNGTVTINGGHNGIVFGDSASNSNRSSPVFKINGGRGTGNGLAGDIIFSTDNSQTDGLTLHTMTNRWWLKGGTGYLSNTATPTTTISI